MISVSRIIHVKVDRRLNVTNKFKYQRRLSSRLPIVMFRGTPCTSNPLYYTSDLQARGLAAPICTCDGSARPPGRSARPRKWLNLI